MPKKSLCISDEILFDDEGTARPIAVGVVAAALAEWPVVVIFTRRPGVCKRELGLAEAALALGNTGYRPSATPLNRRVTFSMKRPDHSVLIARDCINWDGAVPSLRSVGMP
jgi:hypothetical protein